MTNASLGGPRPLLPALLVALLLWLPSSAAAADSVAIKGYDPVAYFTENRPIKGSSTNSYEWQGQEWHFASPGNRERFIGDPDRYAPQYGGYCAFGIAEGGRFEVDPQAWTIVAGKLYLTHDTAVMEAWRENRLALIEKADRNWPALAE